MRSGKLETPIEGLTALAELEEITILQQEKESISSLAEPDEIEEVKKEIGTAIDSIVNNDLDTDFIEANFADFDAYQQMPEQVETSYSNILHYWSRDDSSISLTTHYEKPYQQQEEENNIIQQQETKTYNTAIKTNFNARLRNEGLVMAGAYETFEEHESNILFKAMNPGLWKFMYEASSFMIFSTK